ncbi:transposase family protein [Streptomyces sp. PA5.6]|uniref:transposase family protein n=1 Tax=Streptomyces sp. PA5.6 TaxID=3035651 RepID=UPI0039048FD8
MPRLEVLAVACGPPSRCPGCRARARRVHSTYERGLAESPLAGRNLQIRLRVRRFFAAALIRYAEQLDGSDAERTPA